MTKKEEKKYFGKEWRKMKAELTSFLKGGEQEDLHRFRIQVKKLRAFLILLDGAAEDPKLIRNFKPIKKIFKRAGEIRNAFIYQELGKTLETGRDEFMNNQLQLQLKTTKKFKSKKVRFLKELKETRRVLIKKIKPVSDLQIYLFYQNQLHQIATFMENPEFNDQLLHEYRKRVKILLYNFKPAHAALGSGLNEEYLEKVQIAIGDWHDHILTLNLLSGNNSIIDRTTLQRASSKLRKKIIALTKDFYTQATTTIELPLEQLS